jgi:hypothetical protein
MLLKISHHFEKSNEKASKITSIYLTKLTCVDGIRDKNDKISKE